jgi:hypothetical protein
MSLRHVSTLKGPSSDSTIDTFRWQCPQNESLVVKFNLVSGVWCVSLQSYGVMWLVTHFVDLTAEMHQLHSLKTAF